MDGYIGEIKLFPGEEAPTNWKFCHGQTLLLTNESGHDANKYQDLFMIIGTTYGGDGKKNFKLPDMRGKVPRGVGRGKDFVVLLGDISDREAVTLNEVHMPMHTHNSSLKNYSKINPTLTVGYDGELKESVENSESDNVYLNANSEEINMFRNNPTKFKSLDVITSKTSSIDHRDFNVDSAGGNASFSIMDPYLVLNYIICVHGTMPRREKGV